MSWRPGHQHRKLLRLRSDFPVDGVMIGFSVIYPGRVQTTIVLNISACTCGISLTTPQPPSSVDSFPSARDFIYHLVQHVASDETKANDSPRSFRTNPCSFVGVEDQDKRREEKR
jgi:hypothetical protein